MSLSLSFPPDHRSFRIPCGADGTRLDQRAEHDRERLDRLRRSLEELITCENTLDLLLRFVSGAVTATDIADATGVHRCTPKRRFERELDRIRNWFLPRLVHVWLSLVVPSGGCTLDPPRAEPVEADAWAVSLAAYVTTFPTRPTFAQLYDDFTVKLPIALFSAVPLYLGGCRDDQHRYFADLTVLVTNRAEAVALALEQNQESIYHLRTHESIMIGSTKRRKRAA